MAQLDVYKTSLGEYLLDFQADLLSHLNTRFVIPLANPTNGPQPAVRLNPQFEIDGQTMVLYTQFAMTVPVSDLATHIVSLDDRRFEIIAAFDMLISGF